MIGNIKIKLKKERLALLLFVFWLVFMGVVLACYWFSGSISGFISGVASFSGIVLVLVYSHLSNYEVMRTEDDRLMECDE